ncbi:MAG: tRNA pseudouridine(55) synthase TruB [Pseudomonadota bacterium]
MARNRRKGRSVSGVLLLHKPRGLSSNRSLQRAKRLFDANKAGHTGNLDREAEGLLPVCFGEATKFCQYLLDADKSYEATVRLGIETATGDVEGEVLAQHDIPGFDEADLQALIEKFTGEIEQVPPMYSALKVDGQPLHRLARKGIEVERQPRRICIYDLAIARIGRDQLGMRVRCSKGTYIRTLAMDIGRNLGCGAHLSSLKRTASGPFGLDAATSLAELEALEGIATGAADGLLLAPDSILEAMPQAIVGSDEARALANGQSVAAADPVGAGLLRLYDSRRRFLGVGELDDGDRIVPRRLMQNVNNAA